MKTWEIMRELTENPNKKFRKDTWADGIWITIDEYGYLIEEDGELLGMPSINDEWEEVPQEVTWQEAIEAWVNGSCVKSVLNQEEHVYNESQGFVSDQNYSLQDNSDVLATWSFHTLTKEEILYAKWYIL